MKMGLLFAALLSGLFSARATAESPVGSWTFETAKISPNCTLSGDMRIWPGSGEGAFLCRFTSLQLCDGEPPLQIRVEQSCTASLRGAQLNIRSKIEKTLSVSPEDRRDDVDAFYAPDNFFVSMHAGGDEMTGMFRSVGQAFVRFIRREDLVS